MQNNRKEVPFVLKALRLKHGTIKRVMNFFLFWKLCPEIYTIVYRLKIIKNIALHIGKLLKYRIPQLHVVYTFKPVLQGILENVS